MMSASPTPAAQAPAPVSAREQRQAELVLLSVVQLVALVLQHEFPTAAAPAAATAATLDDAAEDTPMDAGSVSGKKHPHSPSALEGEPTAKQSRKQRALERKADSKARLDALMHTPSAAATATVAAASSEATAASAAPANSSSGETPGDGAAPAAAASNKGKKRGGDVDWSAVQRRQIALKVMYIGSEFAGFAIQPQLTDARTVEGEIIRALLLTKLAPERDAARLTRCGRTDKGVHSCGQVVACQVRSRLTDPTQLGALPKNYQWRDALAQWHAKKAAFLEEDTDGSLFDAQGYLAPPAQKDSMCPRCGVPGVGFATDADCSTHEQELDYCRVLNGVLPPAIRVVAWQPCSPDFNARFSCSARSYRYFFHADALDLRAMQTAADLLVGSHDFRNFCRQDPTMSTHHTRFLTSIEVKRCEQVPEDCVQISAPWPCDAKQWREDTRNSMGTAQPTANEKSAHESNADSNGAAAGASDAALRMLHPDTMCELLIHGNAFLYHQVRCMAAVLFLVGRGVEQPSIVSRLLDVSATPNKPTYDMASEVPLVLYDTWFPALPVTPGFDYQVRPASKPEQRISFIGLAASKQSEGEQHMAQHDDAPMQLHTPTAAAQEAATAIDATPSPSSVTSTAALTSAPAVPSASAASSPSATPSPSPSPAATPVLNLYPSAAACLRNHELVFAHFHSLWRGLSMQGKVHELFVNQCARNLQSVRNETAKVDLARLQHLQAHGAHIPPNKRVKVHTPVTYAPPPVVRQCAPLLAATVGCRGHGLRPMPFVGNATYTPLLKRPLEPSYDDKVAALKGKKLAHHEMVRTMADKFKKDSNTFAPVLTKMDH